jgi:cytochrome c-type biogenesis protein CcmH
VNSLVVAGILMGAVALAFVLVPLLRRRRPGFDAAEVAHSNLSILRDQGAELSADLARGTISPAQYADARAELERRALEEDASPAAKGAAAPAARWTAAVLAVLIPAGVLAMYLWVGEPAGLRSEAVAQDQPVGSAEIEKMVAGLAQRLEKNPDDARGWTMLARSYYVLQKMPEAAAAYAKAVERITGNADLYADYADALAMSQGRRIEGKPLDLVKESLRIDPVQPKALAMAGTEAFNRKDYAASIAYWEKLLPLLPPDSEMAKSVGGGIAEARELGKSNPPQAAAGSAAKPGAARKPVQGPAQVSGRVTLSPGLAGRANPQDTLFIVARAQSGPRIPLAVLRRRVADLPADFTLDDTLAMSPELKLSAFPDVVVIARISKSGNAMPQPGDLQGASPAVKVGARGLAIVIDSVVP